MTLAVPIRRGFPRAALIVLPRRGVGQGTAYAANAPLYSDLAPGNVLSSLWTNITTGSLSPAQLAAQGAATNAANKQAATSPTTGVVNQALQDQANAQAAAEIPAAANVSNISTGSWLANFTDMLQGTYTGALGLPGSTPPLGTPVPSGGSGFDWASIAETVAIYGGIGLGAYLLLKKLLK